MNRLLMSDDDDELRVDVVELGELIGVDVHQQQLVGRRLRHGPSELRVEVAHVSLALLHHRPAIIDSRLHPGVQLTTSTFGLYR